MAQANAVKVQESLLLADRRVNDRGGQQSG